MRPSTRWLLPLFVLAFAGMAPAAHAATIVSYNGTQGLAVNGDDTQNIVRIEPRTGAAGYLVTVFGQAFSFGGCTQGVIEGGSTFDCPATGAHAITVSMAGANDGVVIRAFPPSETVNPVNLGDGNDDYSSLQLQAPVTVDGGNGNDEIRGGVANDTLRGGPGRDDFFGHNGTDTMQGGEDDDEFLASANAGNDPGFMNQENTPPLPDVMDGGPGVDEVNYMFTPDPVTVSLDNVANDGRFNENDNAINIENAIGGQAGSTITGNGLANRLTVSSFPISVCCPATTVPPVADDVIHGGDGADRIGGGRGNDQLFGEGDNDIIWGGPENDMVDGGGGVDDLRDGTQSGVVIDGGPNGGNDPSFASGENGDDVLFGGPGEDLINTREGTDVTHGGDDADTIQANALNEGEGAMVPETVFGDDGNDKITGSGTATTLIRIEGNDGNDEIHGAFKTIELGGIGDDKILNFSGSGIDTIEGGPGNDTIESGTSGFGGEGVDHVNGGTGADLICNCQASGGSTGSDTIFGGPGADTIDTHQRPPNASGPSPDTVDCGRNTFRRDDDGDTLTKDLMDTAKDCDNVTDSPYRENVDVSVPRQTLAVPARGRVEVEVHCIRKRAPRAGCEGTIRLGTLAINGNAGPPGPKQHFQIDRGETETLLVPIRNTARAKLRNKANERARIEIVQPGDKGPHTTIRALEARKE